MLFQSRDKYCPFCGEFTISLEPRMLEALLPYGDQRQDWDLSMIASHLVIASH